MLFQHAVLRVPLPTATTTVALRIAVGATAVGLLPRDALVAGSELDFETASFFYVQFPAPGVSAADIGARVSALLAPADWTLLTPPSLVVAYARAVFRRQERQISFDAARRRWETEKRIFEKERELREKERETERGFAKMVIDNAQILALGYDTMFSSMKQQSLMLAALASQTTAVASLQQNSISGNTSAG